MRASTAYFAGAGTVIAAIAAGLGGGLLMADIISPKSPRPGAELTRLERRMSPEPIQVTATPAEPVPFVSAPPRFAAGTTVGAAVAQTEPQTETASASRAPDPGPARQAAVPEDAAAKVRDTEAKRANDRRDAEMKRAEDERRQQWVERRRHQQRQQELRAAGDKVREDVEPTQQFTAEPVKIEMPRIRLFGPE